MKLWLKQRKNHYTLTIVALDLIFFSVTNPSRVPSLLLVFGVALLVATFCLVLTRTLGILAGQFAALHKHRRKILTILCLFVAFIIAMQSIGQLTLRDVLAITPFVVILYVYLIYFLSEKAQ